MYMLTKQVKWHIAYFTMTCVCVITCTKVTFGINTILPYWLSLGVDGEMIIGHQLSVGKLSYTLLMAGFVIHRQI